MNEKLHLEVAKSIGEPIDQNFPVPMNLAKIADLDTAEPGEKVLNFSQLDEDVDEILQVEADGRVNAIKVNPKTDTLVTFQGLNSRLQYVLVDEILNGASGQGNPDLGVLGRKKEGITRGMDKLEFYRVTKAIMDAASIATITPTSGQDLYDVIMSAKHALENYGDGFVMLCGTSVKEGIDLYDKAQADNFNYNVTLTAKLRELGIEVVKVFGQVKRGTIASGETVQMLDTNKFILVATNSTQTQGKPVHFVRRRISPEIAQLMGANVDSAQRALFVNPFPVNIGGTNPNTLAYGVYGYEAIVEVIKNPKAIVKSADLSSILGANL